MVSHHFLSCRNVKQRVALILISCVAWTSPFLRKSKDLGFRILFYPNACELDPCYSRCGPQTSSINITHQKFRLPSPTGTTESQSAFWHDSWMHTKIKQAQDLPNSGNLSSSSIFGMLSPHLYVSRSYSSKLASPFLTNFRNPIFMLDEKIFLSGNKSFIYLNSYTFYLVSCLCVGSYV